MTAEIQLNQSVNGLKTESLSYEEIIAQSIAVIVSATTPAANLALISTSACAGILLNLVTNGRQKTKDIL